MIRLTTGMPHKAKRWNRKRVSNLAATVAALMLFASTQVNSPAGSEGIANLREAAQAGDVQPLTVDQSTGPDESNEGSKVVSIPDRKHRGLMLSLFRFRR